MLEIGIFHNGASDLPCVRTKDGIVVNDGNLTEVHESNQRVLVNQVRHLLAEPPRVTFCVSSERPHRTWRNRGSPAIGRP